VSGERTRVESYGGRRTREREKEIVRERESVRRLRGSRADREEGKSERTHATATKDERR